MWIDINSIYLDGGFGVWSEAIENQQKTPTINQGF